MFELELELILSHMTQKPMLRGEVDVCVLYSRFMSVLTPAAMKDGTQPI